MIATIVMEKREQRRLPAWSEIHPASALSRIPYHLMFALTLFPSAFRLSATAAAGGGVI